MNLLPFELWMSLRYMRSGRRGIALGVWVSVGGVTIGIAALIATLGVMTGFSEEIRDKILGTNAHIIISDAGGANIASYRDVIRQAEATPHVVAAAPFLLRQVLLASETQTLGVVLRGIDPAAESRISDLQKNMIDGTLFALAATRHEGERPGIIVGRELAARLGVFTSDEVHVISPVGQSSAGAGAFSSTPKIRKFRVVGIFDSGMLEYDTALVYIHLADAQVFFNLSDVASGVQVKSDDLFTTDRLVRTIAAQLKPPLIVRDWMEMNRNLFAALRLEKTMMFIVLVLIVLVASLNMVSLLTMTVVEKRREIAILKAMGATTDSIMRIFMLEGLVISGIGLLLGLPLGAAICMALQKFYTLPGDVYYLNHLPVHILPIDVALVAAAALLIGLLVTLYPSRQAARLDPVEAFRQ